MIAYICQNMWQCNFTLKLVKLMCVNHYLKRKINIICSEKIRLGKYWASKHKSTYKTMSLLGGGSQVPPNSGNQHKGKRRN